eukprot:GHVL01013116.1.p1 GENE.GHVL01013116.1~~GHVL01013116.1.p1  ORF type:complete len:116 (-),score=17.61 GHVL01013116.1:148-495(-)
MSYLGFFYAFLLSMKNIYCKKSRFQFFRPSHKLRNIYKNIYINIYEMFIDNSEIAVIFRSLLFAEIFIVIFLYMGISKSMFLPHFPRLKLFVSIICSFAGGALMNIKTFGMFPIV